MNPFEQLPLARLGYADALLLTVTHGLLLSMRDQKLPHETPGYAAVRITQEIIEARRKARKQGYWPAATED